MYVRVCLHAMAVLPPDEERPVRIEKQVGLTYSWYGEERCGKC